MYYRIELTHRAGVPLTANQRRREDWLFGSVTLSYFGATQRKVKVLTLKAPRVNNAQHIAYLYKPEFVHITARSLSFSGLERVPGQGLAAWVLQGWRCSYADDGDFVRWVKSLPAVPAWAALLVH